VADFPSFGVARGRFASSMDIFSLSRLREIFKSLHPLVRAPVPARSGLFPPCRSSSGAQLFGGYRIRIPAFRPCAHRIAVPSSLMPPLSLVR